MAGERHIEAKVGLLVAICVGILVAFVVVLGDFSSAPGATLYLDVGSSASLKSGATVKIAGVNAGKVVAVDYKGGEVDPAVGRPVHVRVTLGLDRTMLGSLRKSSRFFITTQGVLGEKYIEIDPGTDDAPFVKDGDVLEGEPPLRLELMALNANRVLSSLAELLRKNEKALDDIIGDAAASMSTIRKTIERLDGLMVSAAPKVDKVLDQMSGLQSDLATTLAGVNKAIGDGSELRRTVLNVESISGRIKEEVGPIAADAKTAMKRVDKLGAELEVLVGEARAGVTKVLDQIGGVLADAKELTGRLKDGQGTIGALLSDREMYDDLREMMKDLKRHPWKFIWKE
ncbi:MAG: MCE family protein [Deltaproteobacteria bacterium]|nr:MCE family protein [Deltaproteobacteria bacterium]